MALIINSGAKAEVLPFSGLGTTDSFTLAGWVYLENVSETHWLFNFVNAGGSYRFSGFYVSGAGATWASRIRSNGGTQAEIIYSQATTSGAWVPVTMTWNEATGTQSLRVNGGPVETDVNTLIDKAKSRLCVGFVESNGVDIASGNFKVAYLRAWRRALSASEIDAFHAAASESDVNAISTTSIIEGYDFIGDADSDSGGVAATLSAGATVNSDTPFTTTPYVLTSHGPADPNSIMADANFATTGTVEIRIISDFDPAKVEFDWQAFSDGQLWRDDVNTLAAVTVNSATDTTDSATIGWKTPDGTEGQFTANLTVSFALPQEPSPPAIGRGMKKALKLTLKKSLRADI